MDKRTGLRKSQKRARRALYRQDRKMVGRNSAWRLFQRDIAKLERDFTCVADAFAGVAASVIAQVYPLADPVIGYGHVRDIGEMLTPQSAPDSDET